MFLCIRKISEMLINYMLYMLSIILFLFMVLFGTLEIN